jgi:uncharacterized protein YjbJ (UPF0337 family)
MNIRKPSRPKGKVKEVAGKMTGDATLESEGERRTRPQAKSGTR